ncbi:hypothetical protein BJX63DRAFT_80851 [Aspergillus granulosus]|uniref:Uncharacterized protein n=1 Tax=Aspergillus granulosus TaxID=176169 RepID=A0ABR4GVQ3_9EURO
MDIDMLGMLGALGFLGFSWFLLVFLVEHFLYVLNNDPHVHLERLTQKLCPLGIFSACRGECSTYQALYIREEGWA